MNRIALRDRALVIARGQIGVREEGRPNAGQQVERYLFSVGLGPGYPWCAAFVVWCYDQAALELGYPDQPVKRTGKCARLWHASPTLWRSHVPTVGAIYIHLVDPDDPESNGHCGIVTDVRSVKSFVAIEGNTNGEGSRLGDRVRENVRPRGYALGFLDVGREGPVDSPAVA